MAERQPKKFPTSRKQFITKESKLSRPSSSSSKGNKITYRSTELHRTTRNYRGGRPYSSIGGKGNDNYKAASNNVSVTEETTNPVSHSLPSTNTGKAKLPASTIMAMKTESEVCIAGNKSHSIVPTHIVSYQGTNYDLSQHLSPDSQLAKDQAKNVGKTLNITTLGTNLSSLALFVRLACCGVVGHTELQIETRKALINVGDITDDTYHTLREFERTSKSALQAMKLAYGYLKSNMEGEAIKMFNQIQKKSEEMQRASEALSKRCMEESTKVNNLGIKTLREKRTSEKEKEDSDKSASTNRVEKTHEEKLMEDCTTTINKTERMVEVALDAEKRLFEDKKKLREEIEKKLELERQNVKKEKAELKSNYDANESKITNETEESQLKFKNNLLANKKLYEQTLQELDAAAKEKLKLIEDTYQAQIKKNEEDLQEAKRRNNKLHEQKIKEYEESYPKCVSDAEIEYKVITDNIEKDYQNAIQTSNDELQNKLRLATQKLDAALEANKQKYNAKLKACWTDKGKADVHEEWSTSDEGVKKNKCESENSARNENVSAHRRAQETRTTKLNKASENKYDKLVKAEEDKKLPFKIYMDLINEAEKKKRDKDATDKLNKEKSISDLEIKRTNDELKAKEKKEEDDKSVEALKTEVNKANELKRNTLYQKYKEDLQEIETTLEKTERKINIDYEENLKRINEELQNSKEKRAGYESAIKASQEKSKMSLEKISKLTQELKENEDLSKRHEVSVLCLHEAETALNNIQAILRDAVKFWKDVTRHCKGITENELSTQINMLMETSERAAWQQMFQGDMFKEAALEYQGQWNALKDLCANASEDITLVQGQIHQYICETPTKGEALELVQKLAANLLHIDRFKKPSDKPADN